MRKDGPEAGKEHNPIMDEKPRDVRQTAAQWVELIEKTDSPAMLMVIAESLSGGHMLREDDEDKDEVKLQMDSCHLVEIALTKYMEITEVSVVTLMDKIVDSVAKEKRDNPTAPRDFLELKLVVIDLLINRKKQKELQNLFLYLNVNRDFIPFDLLKIKIVDIRQAMDEIADTQKMQMCFQKAVSGVIYSDK